MRLKPSTAGVPIALAAYVLALSTTSANAYLDAGTGSMILQVLLGGVAGLAMVGKLYWHRLMIMFGIRKEPAPVEAAEERVVRTEARADR